MLVVHVVLCSVCVFINTSVSIIVITVVSTNIVITVVSTIIVNTVVYDIVIYRHFDSALYLAIADDVDRSLSSFFL